MKKRTEKSLIILGIFLIVLILYLFFIANSPKQYNEFAQCLTDKGVTIYGTDWCSFCRKQKDLFGDSFKYITFVECDKNKQECLSVGVTIYPTWRINEKNYPGVQQINRLSQLSGCAL